MIKKIRLLHIAANADGIDLLKQLLRNSTVAGIATAVVYYPGIGKHCFHSGCDLIALDIPLPCAHDQLIGELRAQDCPRILINCDFFQPDLILECLMAGASGFVEKDYGLEKLEQAILDCIHHGIRLPFSLSSMLFRRNDPGEENADVRRILRLLAKGYLLHDVSLQTGIEEEDIRRLLYQHLRKGNT